MSDANKSLLTAYKKGYYVTDTGKIIGAKGEPLKPMLSNKNYLYFHVRVDGKKKAVYVHRLKAYQKYGDELFSSECVRHLDGNKQNNTMDNIALGTHKENTADIPEQKRYNMNKRARDLRKLTDKQIIHIRNLLENGETIRSVAKEYGVSQSTIQQIKERKTYKWII